MSFSSDVAKFKTKVIGRATKFKQAVGVELFSSVILDTPVDTGRARGNWQVTLNTPANGEVETTATQSISTAGNPSNYGKLDDDNYLTNNLPYIGKLEFGSSTQAPEGMVRRNVARVQQIIDRKFREHKS